jgi:hypothetical protein
MFPRLYAYTICLFADDLDYYYNHVKRKNNHYSGWQKVPMLKKQELIRKAGEHPKFREVMYE